MPEVQSADGPGEVRTPERIELQDEVPLWPAAEEQSAAGIPAVQAEWPAGPQDLKQAVTPAGPPAVAQTQVLHPFLTALSTASAG